MERKTPCMKGIWFVITGVFVGLLVSACQRGPSSPHASEQAQVFSVRGVFHQARGEEDRIWILDHEEIPGFMERMIMPFRVKEWEGKLPDVGEEIAFVYVVEETESWIEQIELTGKVSEVTVKPFDETAYDGSGYLAPGEVFPDFPFTNEAGEPTVFSDFRGQPVALTFVFTACPVPEYCPAMMRQFAQADAKLREALAERQGEAIDWRLLTVSFDYKRDNPEVMKAYGEAYGARPDSWSLLSTPNPEVVADIASLVGLKIQREQGTFMHNLRTVVLDRDGRMVRLFTDETWSVEELIATLEGV